MPFDIIYTLTLITGCLIVITTALRYPEKDVPVTVGVMSFLAVMFVQEITPDITTIYQYLTDTAPIPTDTGW